VSSNNRLLLERYDFMGKICFSLSTFMGVFAIFLVSIAFADNVIDNPGLLYMSPLKTNSQLLQKITVKRKVSDINDLVTILNNVPNISATVKTQTATKPTPLNLSLNDETIEKLLNSTSRKLGYNWQVSGNTINFYAINPIRSNDAIVKNSIWSLNPADRTLRTALNRWCKSIGWQLIWNVNADYPIVTSWNITGSFENAVNQVLAASQTTNVPLLATMHDQNRVLEIYSENSNK
jgi:hypothetical protein